TSFRRGRIRKGAPRRRTRGCRRQKTSPLIAGRERRLGRGLREYALGMEGDGIKHNERKIPFALQGPSSDPFSVISRGGRVPSKGRGAHSPTPCVSAFFVSGFSPWTPAGDKPSTRAAVIWPAKTQRGIRFLTA